MSNLSMKFDLRVIIAAVCTLAVITLLWPIPEMTTQSLTVDAIKSETERGPTVLPTDKIHSLFDLTRMPSAIQPAQPPAATTPTLDPAAAIRRYTLMGVTANEHEAVALLSDGASQITIKEGDRIAGFAVTDIRSRQVVFEKDGVVATLSLP